jgi:hypothetical protein
VPPREAEESAARVSVSRAMQQPLTGMLTALCRPLKHCFCLPGRTPSLVSEGGRVNDTFG